MNLLNKEQMEVKKVLTAKNDSEIIKAVHELCFCVGIEGKPILNDVLFHWLHTHESEMDERSEVIFTFQRIMEFIETISKINLAIEKKDLLIDRMDERVN